MRLALTPFFVFFSFWVSAQMPDLAFEHLTTKQGLPSNDLWCAIKDKQGFLWLGTSRSISRYDGYQFDTFAETKVGYCSGISMDKQGNIYASIATKGLCEIDPKTLKMTTLLAANYNDKDFANDHYEQVFVDSYNQAWTSDLMQVKQYDLATKKLMFYPLVKSQIAHQIANFFEDSHRNLWVISDVGLYLFDRKLKKMLCLLGKDAQNPENQLALRLWRATEDSQGNLWIAGNESQLIKYSPVTQQFKFYKKGVEKKNLTSVQESIDETGRPILFVGTKQGLSVFRPDEEQFYPIKEFNEKGIQVMNFFDDKENGIVWIISKDGLYKYRYKNVGIRTINLPKELVTLPVGVMAICENPLTNNEFFLGLSHSGVLKWNAITNQFKLYKYPISAFTNKIRWQRGQLWAFTDKGIFVLKDLQAASFELEKYHLLFSSTEMMDAIFDKKGQLWLANWVDGLKVIDPKTGKEMKLWSENVNQKFFKNNYLKDIEQDKNGRIWVAACPNALLYFDEKIADFVSIKDLKINHGRSLGGYCINRMQLNSDNSLLTASWGGINKIDHNGYILTTFDYQQDNLVDTYCGNIGEDENGNFWFSSNEGINIADAKTRTVRRFTSTEGLYNNSAWGFFMSHRKELLLGYNNCINLLNINELGSEKTIPKIAISSVEVLGKTLNQDLSKGIQLNRNENTITFNFSTLSFDPPSKDLYQYQLVGFNKNWVDLGSKNAVTFTNLDPKSYQLKVKSGNSLGLWNNKALIINLLVEPAFYETWWFRSIIFLALVGLLFGFWRWRLNAIHEKNRFDGLMSELKLKALQSQMNPHFLFNSLNSIQNYIISNKPIEGAKYLSKFSKLVRKILDNSNYPFIKIEQIMETLKMYVELESFRFNNEFHYEFIYDEEDNELMQTYLPPMLLQPFVENAIWHGLMPKEGDKKLVIEIKHEKNTIKCIVDDNGIGRKVVSPKEGHTSRGEEITKNTFDAFRQQTGRKTEFKITDKTNENGQSTGTQVEIIIPH